MKNIDIEAHVTGRSLYLDDLPMLHGTLFGEIFSATVAHAEIISLDVSAAEQYPGVVRIFTYKDIPGENQIGGIVADEVLMAEKTIHFCGMPIAFVVATSVAAAQHARSLIKLETKSLPIITNPREAVEKGHLIIPPRQFKLGNSQEAFKNCAHIFEGIAETNGQEHLYIETQGAYAMPSEKNGVKVYSSTQGPTAVQKHMADVLNLPMHKIEVDVTRLGGGFGGKEDQATAWAIFCGLAAHLLQQPVKYSMHRMDDMKMTGKRNPYSSNFKIGLNQALKIIAYEVSFFQNAGAAADLSPAVLERTLFHCTNSYFIPNLTATAYCCRTNLPPNTAFRGFGGPQGMYVIEAAIAKAAEGLGVSAMQIQEKNLIKDDDAFPYGQLAQSRAAVCWQKATALFNLKEKQQQIKQFNEENKFFKKGLAAMPICFGISFTKINMNQARALVHVYMDGSINISTGAVEMGQGVNTKMLQVAADVFSLPIHLFSINTTNTFRIINTSPSAASATADLNGQAVEMASKNILERLKIVAAKSLNALPEQINIKEGVIFVNNVAAALTWKELVLQAFLQRINLSEHAHYATPKINFDASIEKGHPFAYHVYGTSFTTVTVDALRGTYVVDEVDIVHDIGKSKNTAVDIGQLEGGLMQGIGWMTMEEIVYDQKGVLKSNALSTYKVPDIYAAPKKVNIFLLETEKEEMALQGSKAVGEPPLMYGLGTWFAIADAIKAINPAVTLAYETPFTPEKVLMALYSSKKEFLQYEKPIGQLSVNKG